MLGTPLSASALSVGAMAAGGSDLTFTVISTSAVYAPVDGASVVFAELRNDNPTTTMSVGRAFAVTFYDSAGDVLGVVSGAAPLGSPASLATGLRAVPPGQLGDVSATLPGVVAASARITNAAASGSPYSDARLPTTGVPTRTSLTPSVDALAVTAVNTTGYPDRLHVVVAAEDPSGAVLGIDAAPASDPVPSGASETLTVDYQRLPGEPVADHYDVFIAGQADGMAATALATPSAEDTPVAGQRTTLRSQLTDGRGRGLSGEQLLLVSRLPGGTPTVLARARTDAGGRASLVTVIPKTGVLQVVFNGDPTHAPAGTGDFSFRLLPRLTVGVTASGSGYLIHGAVPDYPGEKVTVQEKLRGMWHTLRVVKADGHGGFRLLVKPTVGRHTYRVSVPATEAHLAAASGSVGVTVHA